jgi:hypothetical protein
VPDLDFNGKGFPNNGDILSLPKKKMESLASGGSGGSDNNNLLSAKLVLMQTKNKQSHLSKTFLHAKETTILNYIVHDFLKTFSLSQNI